MKPLHEITAEPSILDYVALLHPSFVWTLEGNTFAYWRPENPDQIFRDMYAYNVQPSYERWLDAGANPEDASAY